VTCVDCDVTDGRVGSDVTSGLDVTRDISLRLFFDRGQRGHAATARLAGDSVTRGYQISGGKIIINVLVQSYYYCFVT
jgi:hypothetical protein